jgi:hypothetical protein
MDADPIDLNTLSSFPDIVKQQILRHVTALVPPAAPATHQTPVIPSGESTTQLLLNAIALRRLNVPHFVGGACIVDNVLTLEEVQVLAQQQHQTIS